MENVRCLPSLDQQTSASRTGNLVAPVYRFFGLLDSFDRVKSGKRRASGKP
jgi:hypothetical protein